MTGACARLICTRLARCLNLKRAHVLDCIAFLSCSAGSSLPAWVALRPGQHLAGPRSPWCLRTGRPSLYLMVSCWRPILSQRRHKTLSPASPLTANELFTGSRVLSQVAQISIWPQAVPCRPDGIGYLTRQLFARPRLVIVCLAFIIMKSAALQISELR